MPLPSYNPIGKTSSADTQSNLKFIADLLAIIAVFIGLIHLIGWAYDIRFLKDLLSDGASMKFNTALLIVFAGIAVILQSRGHQKMAAVLCITMLLLCSAVLAEQLLSVDLHIDNLIVYDHFTNAALETPGRTSALTALDGLIITAALLLINFRLYAASQAAALIAFLFTYASLLGHLFQAGSFYKSASYSGISFSTAVALMLLAAAVLFSRTVYGWMGSIYKKVASHHFFFYTVSYILSATPVLIALYLFIIRKNSFSREIDLVFLISVTALISIPIAYMLLHGFDRLNQDLKTSNERYSIALHATGMGVWDLDLQSSIIDRSEKLNELIGHGNTPVLTINQFFDLVYPEHRPALQAAFETAKKAGTINLQLMLTINSSPRWLQIYGETHYNQLHEPLRMLGTMMDITANKELERHKDEFISTVSHELKTPITSIKAQTQILERKFSKTADLSTSMMLHRINLQVNRLNTIIRDLLEAGRIGEKKILLRNDAYFFNDLAAEIVSEVQSTTNTHQIILETEDQVLCHGDKERTGQILSNLLTNAVKYSPHANKVLVNYEINNGKLYCRVQDFGMGIPDDIKPQIFARFYRSENNEAINMISGFGLGLYICQEIVKQMGGNIWVDSTPGKGSTFYFSLPIFI